MNIFTRLLLAGASFLLVQQASAQSLLDNFENTRLLSYPGAGGTLTQNAPNPASNTVNSSSTVGGYMRSAIQYDYITIVPSGANFKFVNVADYAAGTKRISMKFRSPAAGTRVELVLQNATKAATGYPNGNFGGTFAATTTAANTWETLTFTYTAGAAGAFDPTVTANDVNQMTMLIAPNTTATGQYYMDDITGPETVAGTGGGGGTTGPPVSSVLLDNFENTRLLTYPNVGGTLTQNTPNPASGTGNSSATVASYVRGAIQYDYITVKPNVAPFKFGNVSNFVAATNPQRISMKFRSPAAGVRVELVLQNGAKVATGYPNGNFGGTFAATTTAANAWETLTFTYTAGAAGAFDPTVTANDVDQLTILIAPNTTGTGTYYFDDITGPDVLRTTTPPGGGMAVKQLWDNYDGTRVIKYISYKTSGGFKLDTLINTGTGNNNSRAMRYTRSTNQYDALVVHPRGAALNDVSAFRANTEHMTMRVFSPAPGIVFQITLQDSTVANGGNYPAGRNSEYTATTTVTNGWENLTFNFINSPSSTPSTGLNEIVLLISPNTMVARKVLIDDWYGPSLVGFVPTATRTVQSAIAAFAPVYPNPTSDVAHLPISLERAANVSLTVVDMLGRQVAEVLRPQQHAAGRFTADVQTSRFAPGLYTCRLVVDGVVMTRTLSVQ